MEYIEHYLNEQRRIRSTLEELLEKNAHINAQMTIFMKDLNKKCSTDASTQTFRLHKKGFTLTPIPPQNSNNKMVEPVIVDEGIKAIEPVIGDEDVKAIEPVIVDEDVKAIEPVIVDEGIKANEPDIVDEDVKAIEPVIVDECVHHIVVGSLKNIKNEWTVVKNGIKPKNIVIPIDNRDSIQDTKINIQVEDVKQPQKKKYHKKSTIKKTVNLKNNEEDDKILSEECIKIAIEEKKRYDTLKEYLNMDNGTMHIAKLFIKVFFALIVEKFTVFSNYNEENCNKIIKKDGDISTDPVKNKNASDIIIGTKKLYQDAYRVMKILTHDPNLLEFWNFIIQFRNKLNKQLDNFVNTFGHECPITVHFEVKPGVNTAHNIYHTLHHTIDIISFLCEQRKHIIEYRTVCIEKIIPNYDKICCDLANKIYRTFVANNYVDQEKYCLTRDDIRNNLSHVHMKIVTYSESDYKKIGNDMYEKFCKTFPKILESEKKSTMYELNYEKMSDATKNFVRNSGLVSDGKNLYLSHMSH